MLSSHVVAVIVCYNEFTIMWFPCFSLLIEFSWNCLKLSARIMTADSTAASANMDILVLKSNFFPFLLMGIGSQGFCHF